MHNGFNPNESDQAVKHALADALSGEQINVAMPMKPLKNELENHGKDLAGTMTIHRHKVYALIVKKGACAYAEHT